MPSSVKKPGEESEGQNLHPSYILFQIIFLLLVAGSLTLMRVDQGVTPPPVSGVVIDWPLGSVSVTVPSPLSDPCTISSRPSA